MKLAEAKYLYELIQLHELRSCLELGFYHGVSSAYIAGALQDLGGGSLFTIDRLSAQRLVPNIESVLRSLGLSEFVTYYFEHTSYTWRLMKMIEADYRDKFDLCYIDGGHTWDTTGFAFFLVAKLLKPGGFIIFDDLPWTIKSSHVAHLVKYKDMPEEEQTTPQVRKVFDLLVREDCRFGAHQIVGRWGIARKVK
jgi:predicted O-methyltransferase YrrM